MKSFDDLDAWNVAVDLIAEIYKITESFPKSEQFGITSQLRRAANSIAANIAEGFGRYTYKDKTHTYVIARGECYEVESFLLVSIKLKMTSTDDIENAKQLTKRVRQLLSGLIRSSRVLG